MAARSSRRRLSYETEDSEVCSLCKVHHHRMTRVSTWHAQRACEIVATYGIREHDLVCRPCRDEIHRIEQHPNHVPRWEKRMSTSVLCCVHSCNNTCFAHSKVDAEQLEGIKFDGDTIPSPAPLCHQHYYAIYKSIHHQQQHCPTCGNSFKHVMSRPCPNTTLVTEHLQNMFGIDSNLEASSRVCYKCYKWQLMLVQEEKTVSRDDDLQG